MSLFTDASRVTAIGAKASPATELGTDRFPSKQSPAHVPASDFINYPAVSNHARPPADTGRARQSEAVVVMDIEARKAPLTAALRWQAARHGRSVSATA